MPIRDHIWRPEVQYKDIWFSTGLTEHRAKLHGWYFDIDRSYPNLEVGKRAPIVLFCHGNTGNISYRQYVVELCYLMNLSLFIFDYQGYGYSEGTASIENIYLDGETAYNYLVDIQGYEPKDIIVWGESLGGMVAVDIASKNPCSRLLLMGTFSDLPSLCADQEGLMAKAAYPFMQYQDISNLKKIRYVTAPVFIIHSEEDEIIPYPHAERLYNAIEHNWKALIKIKGGHGTPQITPEILQDVMRFSWHNPAIGDECLNILEYVAGEKNKHGK